MYNADIMTDLKEDSSSLNPGGAALLDRLRREEPLVSDGATGTFLQQHGLEPGGCPEEFNASHPEVVKEMARAYFEAGSDLVSPTPSAARCSCKRSTATKAGSSSSTSWRPNMPGAKHPTAATVMGSVGPTGEFLEPLGPVSESEMYEAFVQQIEALAEGGADGVVVETMTAIEEATLAIRAALENTDLLVMATMVFDKGPRGFFTMMGVTPERAARSLREAGAHVVGTNCGNGIDNMVEVAKTMRQETDGYLLVHSNAGIPAMKAGQIIYPESPEYMAERFKQLADIGVDIIGGCCGTGPEHIRALAQALGR